MPEISYAGQTAIVTGAGRGLGRSYALELARRGAAVVVNDIHEEPLTDVVKEITAEGGRVVPCVANVANPEAARRLVDTAVRELGQVDVLINNAGILRTGYFGDLTDGQIDEVLAVHLRAPFALTQMVWPLMSQRHYGRIVMVSSNSGMFSHHGLSNYAAAKAGVYGLTKALAFEGEGRGIKVNAILPVAPSGPSPTKDLIPDQEAVRVRFMSGTAPVDAWRKEPATITALVTYLASSQCELSGEAFSAHSARYGRVFVGVADGWIAPDPESVSAEEVAAHLGEIRDLSHQSVPMWLFDESAGVAKRLEQGGR